MLKIDAERSVKEIMAFIKKVCKAANKNGVVIGISGGVDSALSAILCQKALGSKNILALLLPSATNLESDLNDAISLCKKLDIAYKILEIEPIYQSFLNQFKKLSDLSNDKLILGNLKPRIRMIVFYYYAALYSRLVCGTGNYSEFMIGYSTKWGDSAADFFPILHLYKTQVWQLAEYLRIPESIVKKMPSPGLWVNQTSESEIGLSYKETDLVLYNYLEKRMPIEKIASELNLLIENIKHIIDMINAGRHKRELPPSLLK